MRTSKENRRRAGLLQNTKIRTVTILIAFVFMFMTGINAIARTTTNVPDNIEMYSPADTIDLSEAGLLDDLSGTDSFMGSYMTQAAESFLKTYDSVMIMVFKHYAKYMIAIWILLFILQSLLFWLLISLVRRYDRHILSWCFLGVFVSPLLAIVILLLAGKRTESETRVII